MGVAVIAEKAFMRAMRKIMETIKRAKTLEELSKTAVRDANVVHQEMKAATIYQEQGGKLLPLVKTSSDQIRLNAAKTAMLAAWEATTNMLKSATPANMGLVQLNSSKVVAQLTEQWLPAVMQREGTSHVLRGTFIEETKAAIESGHRASIGQPSIAKYAKEATEAIAGAFRK